MIIPVILAGGSGTRLWPLSRKLYPKQFLQLEGQWTMVQNTVQRVAGIPDLAAPILICNEEHRFMAAEQLRDMGVDPQAIILEPAGRNTAPAAALAALKAGSEDDLLLVLPADHAIEDPGAFHDAVSTAREFAQKGMLATFGVTPEFPETGYGYIRKGESLGKGEGLEAYRIRSFVEKPDSRTAESYMESGDFFWNSGIFMFKAGAFLRELRAAEPDMVEACDAALEKGVEDLDFIRLDAGSFRNCPSNSIDYAVMEKTENGVVVPFAPGWSDMGSWETVWKMGKADEDGNVAIGDVVTHDVQGSYLRSGSRLLAALGLEDMVIIENKDAVLVCPRNRVQDVKSIVKELEARNRDEVLVHSKVYRPWGAYETINLDERFQVKRITVKPGAKLSLQKHFHRAEHWIVVKGTALVTRGEESFTLKEDESTYIPLGGLHRLENPGRIPLELIEVQTGSYLGEDDIERLDDVYKRN